MKRDVLHEDAALEDLRHYLKSWRRWIKSWRPQLGYPTQSPIVRVMPPAPPGWADEGDESHGIDEQIADHILRALDAEVNSLPMLKQIAVRLVYLREIGPAVYSHNRMSRAQAVYLCNEAELEMIPKLRARGIVLGGS